MQRHVFISYVHEDREGVDRVQRFLEAAGIPVWRDTADLWPGEDWKQRIRDAITRNALVFVACFSQTSVNKEKTYQNEELVLAVDQFRLRNPDKPWLIPVRLSECPLPSFDLGAGRTLESLQRIDLFGTKREEGTARLVAGVLRIMSDLESTTGQPTLTGPEAASVQSIKSTLLEDTRRIELEDHVSSITERCVDRLSDVASFPYDSDKVTNDISGIRFLAEQAAKYVPAVAELAQTLVVAGAWGQKSQADIWKRSMERVASTAKSGSGKVALINLRQLPLLLLLYAAALASLHRSNYFALKAVSVDARLRSGESPMPLVTGVNAWVPFQHDEMTAQVLVLEQEGGEVTDELFEALRTGRKGKRYTPESDLLHLWCRDWAKPLIPDDDDYTETFDNAEVLLGALGVDLQVLLRQENVYVHGPAYGAFTWRDRYRQPNVEQRMLADATTMGDAWPPIAAGLFGGSKDRAVRALEHFVKDAADLRQRRR